MPLTRSVNYNWSLLSRSHCLILIDHFTNSSLTRKTIQLPIRVAEKFYIILNGLDVVSLLVKYYVPMEHINKDFNIFKYFNINKAFKF